LRLRSLAATAPIVAPPGSLNEMPRGRVAVTTAAITLALAAGAQAVTVPPDSWEVRDGATVPAAGGLSVSLPGTIALRSTTRQPRRIELRLRALGCRAVARVRLDGRVQGRERLETGARRLKVKLRAPPGRHRLSLELAPRAGCRAGSVQVRRTHLRDWVPIGSTAAAAELDSDPADAALLAGELDSITIGSDLQWDVLEPQRGNYRFGPADRVADFAQSHGLELRGHPLIWRVLMPRWLTRGQWTREQLIGIMRERIQTVVGRYRGRVSEWDVVNEPVKDDGELRPTIWSKTIGPDYIALAFQFAHEADPAARLYLNEFRTEVQNPKSDGIYRIASSLVQQGVPIDGVGFQGHLVADDVYTADDIYANLHRFADLGLDVQFTEADVPVSSGSADAPEQRARQAGVYRAMSNACRREPACTRFTLWGLTDRWSWWGAGRVPLPFDDELQPKPAWTALTDELRPR